MRSNLQTGFPNAIWTALVVCVAHVLAAPAHADP